MPWLVTTGPALLYALAFGLGFVLVALAIGRRLLIWLGAGSAALPLEKAAICLLLGAGALAFVPFLLGLAGALSLTSLRAACGVLSLASAFDAWRVLQGARRAFASLQKPPTWLALWALALAPGVLLALLSALTPAIDADGLGYHLTVPKRWLALGSLGYLPTYPYSNTPMGVEMLFTVGLAWGGDACAKLVHFLLSMAAAVAAYTATRRLTSGALPALAVTLLLFGPFGIGTLMGWAYVEGATAAALLAAGLAWLIWYQDRDLGFLRAAGLLLGIGASFKITAGLVPVAMAALTLVLLLREQREKGAPLTALLQAMLVFLPFVALPVLPWLMRSALMTGNPFFPMFAGIIPSRDFTAEQSKAFDQYNRYMVWGVGSGAAWGLGLRKLILAGAAGALALCGVVVWWRQRSFKGRAVTLVVLFTLLIQLGAAGLYKRYWIPVLGLVEVPLLLLLARFAEQRVTQMATLLVTLLLSLFGSKQLVQGANGDVAGLVKTSVGLESQSDYMRRQLPLLPLYEIANRSFAPNAGVMLAGYCGGFHIDRTTYCVDIVQNALRVASWEEFKTDLRRLGVTHVIAPRDWAEPLPERSGPPPIEVGNTSYLIRNEEHALVGRILREHSRLVAPASDQGLYAIDLKSLD